MIFNENDIDFNLIKSDSEFEEMCFDLISEAGYTNLDWRKGSADNGRDIQCELAETNILSGDYISKWFIECKFYTGGVPVDKVSTKFDWADVEGPDNLILITSSHFSDSTKRWIEKKKDKVNYRVSVIDGINLKRIILRFPRIIFKYFITEFEKWVKASLNTWHIVNELPSNDVLHYYWKDYIEYKDRLNEEELGFLFVAYHFSNVRDNFKDSHDLSEYSEIIFAELLNHDHDEHWMIENRKNIGISPRLEEERNYDYLHIRSLVQIDNEEVEMFSVLKYFTSFNNGNRINVFKKERIRVSVEKDIEEIDKLINKEHLLLKA